jgi:glycosyltransferase involved in cell wall biosynthesis
MMTQLPTDTQASVSIGTSRSALPTLSVVIIARNEEAYIAQCIEAVLAATSSIQACDIVLVDSHSEDRTVAIASAYPIRVIRLSATQRCCPALGRHVGARVTRGQYVLFVDGDSTIAPQWVDTALAVLASRSDVAGIAGREDQIYYRDGVVIGTKPDYFGTGNAACEVEQLGGNGLYRRQALEAVGSFNPYILSYEEAELGARLRRAGWRLLRIPELMAYHQTPRPDSMEEYARRLRSHLLTGHGQVLRLAVQQGLFWDHARRLNRLVLSLLWNAVGGAALLASALRHTLYPGLVWLAASLILLLVFMVRSRSLVKPLQMVFDWSVGCWPLLWGMFLPCRDARHFRLAEAIAGDTHAQPLSRPACDGVQQPTDVLGPDTTHTVPHTTKGTQHA